MREVGRPKGVDLRLPAVVLLLVVVLVAPRGLFIQSGMAQENDYRIVPGQRMGRYELSKLLGAYDLGRPTWQGTGATERGMPFWDNHFFVGQALRIDTCRSNGLSFAIFVYRRFDRPETETEASKYKTAEGLGIGTHEDEVLRVLGRAGSTSEWMERQGTIDIPLVEYAYPGLLIRVNRTDRRVLAVGVQTPGGRAACEGDVLILQAIRDVTQRSALTVARPVALTSCEITELRRKLLTDAESRMLYRLSFRIAEQSMDDPPSPQPRVPEPTPGSPTDPERLFSRDMQRIEALGFAYAATGDPRFADRAATYLIAWARTYQPSGHPIIEKDIIGLVRGFSIVSEAIPATTRAEVERWLARLASLRIERRPRWEIDTPTNFFSHRLKIVGMIGYALGNAEFVRYGEDGYRAQVAQNLRPDGSSLDFHQRDALVYHAFNVRALLELATVADKNRVSLYGHQAPSGASLEHSIAFLLPYVREEKVHLEFVRTSVSVDRQRRDFGVPWDPYGGGGAWLLELAGYFNPAFAAEPIRGQVRRTFQTVLNGLRAACGR